MNGLDLPIPHGAPVRVRVESQFGKIGRPAERMAMVCRHLSAWTAPRNCTLDVCNWPGSGPFAKGRSGSKAVLTTGRIRWVPPRCKRTSHAAPLPSIDETKCDFPRLLRIGPGDALMRLPPNRCNVTRSRRAPQVCGQQKIVGRAASRAKYDGRFPDRWWQVWWQRWGIKGTRGDRPVTNFSNLLIMLVTIAV
jgi:hypothetical protein